MTRYALYYAPPAGHPLSRLGAAVIGRDAATGAPQSPPAVLAAADAAWIAERAAEPRRYGFHATLKAPFRLAEGSGETDLLAALAAWAASRAPVPMPRLAAGILGNFVALVPAAPCPALHDLAEAAVRDFDRFRAPPSPDETARRRPDRLSPRERELLAAWGYPYVLDTWRFHMTLSDGLADAADRRRFQALALRLFSADVLAPPPVREVCLFVQDEPKADFILRQRFGFGL